MKVGQSFSTPQAQQCDTAPREQKRRLTVGEIDDRIQKRAQILFTSLVAFAVFGIGVYLTGLSSCNFYVSALGCAVGVVAVLGMRAIANANDECFLGNDFLSVLIRKGFVVRI